MLRDRADKALEPDPIYASWPPPAQRAGNRELSAYQIQLMLLEQQNKKRLMMARQEQDMMPRKGEDIGTSAGNLAATSMEAGASAPSGIAPTTDKSNGVDVQTVEANLQNVLAGADTSQLDLQKLQEYIELLQAKAQRFEAIRKEQAPSRYQILYRTQQKESVQHRPGPSKLEDRYSLPFFDHPELVQGQGKASRIRCNLPMNNFDLYLEKNKDVAFIVYRNFDTDSASILAKRGIDDATSGRAAHLPQHTSETVQPVSRDLIEAIKTLLSAREEYAELLREYSTSYELPAPYLFIYHSRKSLEEFENSLPLSAKTQLSLLSNYVTEQYADEYAAADSLLSQSKISPEYVHYLFKPGDLLLSRVDGQYMGYVATSWPKICWDKKVSRMRATASQNGIEIPLYRSKSAAARMATDKVTVYGCNISAWHWAFDGNFQRHHEKLCLEVPAVEDEGKNATDAKGKNSVETEGKEHKPELREKNISELSVFPIQYASAEIVDKCRRRGKTFWKCRNRSYVSYQDSEMESIQNLVSAFVINSPSEPPI